MHRDRYIFLVNDAARGISVIYDPDDHGKNCRVTFKTIDPSIKKDDYVVVPTNTRVGFTVVKVAEVDVDVDVKLDQPMQWIAGTFNKPAFDKLLADEAVAMQKIRSAELRKERKELRDNLMGDAADELKALPIAGGTPAIESQ